MYDKDKNGSITAEELQEALAKMGEPLPPEDIRDLIRTVDKNMDMQISFEEFQKVFDLIAKRKEAHTAKDKKQEK